VPIALAPRKNTNNLLTIPNNRQFRVQRLKNDLDRNFSEHQTQQESMNQGIPYIDLYGFPIDTVDLQLIPKEQVIQFRMGIFASKGKEMFVATDNLDNLNNNDILSNLRAQGYTYRIFHSSRISIDKLIKTYDSLVIPEESNDNINIDTNKMDALKEKLKSLNEIATLVANTSVSETVEIFLSAALENDASDIHLEPEKDSYNLRLRLDGVLYTFASLPLEKRKGIENRIKLLSGTKLNIDNVPQDGRFSFKYNNQDVDVRVSMLPSNYGYSVVMRLLGTGSVELKLDQLGFDGINKERIENAIDKPQGLILTTGPTGSGKTTTLYTLLTHLNDGGNKIITLEDPIEYKLAGVSQTQIDAEKGFTFAAGLRSILRQDPDILMVGEIRDHETADISVQASLTGHQVLTTIHTNDAAGAIPRLMELGIKGFILADALEVIIGQRLVRKICQNCKHPTELSEKEKAIVLREIQAMPQAVKDTLDDHVEFYSSSGCSECNNLGYRGRIGVYEVMSMTEGLKTLISTQVPSIVQIRHIASQEGMVTMLQDAILKAIRGLTDIKEILKNIQS
jgi:type IV pilus assembly protein PilB